MNIESFRNYCMDKKSVTEDFPFDGETLTFKVAGKIFAITHVDTFESINLKCHPELAIERRERYAAVKPGYHMSKKHWNTIMIDGSIPDDVLYSWIDESYDLVVRGLSLKVRSMMI